ncbi:MAG TPA: phospholipase [Thermoanaerobaculia bacterium]|nr:phospholipase [Thermoanaerobaculia bacterium]
MIETKSIETTVHGRYLVRRGVDDRLLVGFHGYAENAELHLREIEKIPGVEEWTVVAVQALHPFYTRAGEVVASWMTKLDRENAIADNIAYVRRVVEAEGPARRVVFAGFSQGVAMAFRAAAAIGCSGVIALGGDLPPDVVPSVRSLPPVLLGRGTADDWYTDEKFKKDLNFLAAAPGLQTVIFEGGHAWSDAFRHAAGEFLARLA